MADANRLPVPCSAYVGERCAHGHATHPVACRSGGVSHYIRPVPAPCLDENRLFDESRQVVTWRQFAIRRATSANTKEKK